MAKETGRYYRMKDVRLVLVILTIHSNEDIDLLLWSERDGDVRRHRIVRLLTEAYSQRGVPTQSNVAALSSISRKKRV